MEREQGVKGQRPLHTLSKDFGSLLCQVHGIHAASKALRHGSLSVSSQFYVESRKRATIREARRLERKLKRQHDGNGLKRFIGLDSGSQSRLGGTAGSNPAPATTLKSLIPKVFPLRARSFANQPFMQVNAGKSGQNERFLA